MRIYIDVFSAQTGVSRFLELNRKKGWIYDKNEKILPNSNEFLNYTHLLLETNNQMEFFQRTHSVLYQIESFNGIDFSNSYENLFLPKIRYIPKIVILKKII